MEDMLWKKEKNKYERMWQQELYRKVSPGYLSAEGFLSFIRTRMNPLDTIIDFGCGSGLAALPFLEAGCKTVLIDIAENCLADKIDALTYLIPDLLSFQLGCLWNLPPSLAQGDWIYCMDVLEHIPPEKIDDSLKEMALRTKKGGALQVFLVEERMGELIGEQLHLTLHPLSWWTQKMETYWEIEQIEPIIPDVRYCIYVGAPKIASFDGMHEKKPSL
ncbi:MAG: class I SAM-dependent methyltransferase [Chlamydiae bacterium]|nr:class I SAM-dependent methyltransferase [Chlamydiota bacterium]